jgi:signal transduction histidine kinase
MEVTGRSVALKRALINVLTNAKQASPSGGTVTVSTRREDGYAVVVIEDEGPGIPEPEKNRIFDMFVSGKPGGVGLGLYLAKAAVESNRGKITAENRVEGGARFVIRLPAGPPVAQGKTTS